ncbi:hypothetical protein BAUCODRAFT_71631 [Baudoinia panamericana UAMH 10762]|uniref:Protein kinase domain-containing protein n=1 Tax=Baudoinia panamericana (strain UAMH 10762) TaxID=717646 RepID=M2LNJ0_BAUPA|nr:uncharacterized protein BAUCODRAFT_71631 [Baudoinia panamericana UAMH 10762]EMC95922.1 hypothetical protein BAUCODRAFT_71631 [Baudoinia panamericana UAMH 10762]
MANTDDLIDFNVIESHKENIEALPSGRSAKALAQLYSPPLLGATPSPAGIQDTHAKERAPFEEELACIDEADDPLDVYDRYVKWTLDAYPSPQARQTQLLPLLERATKSYQSSSHYRNDPRYLRLWLHYICLFSDAPREIFVYLARHGIGEGLALYYEEFAAWLENAGRWNQAEEIYKMGIDKEARPVERLLRKFGEFERRKEARPQDAAEPTSPALPAVRPALAAKTDPFATASPSTTQQRSRSIAPKKSKASKMAIFSDQSGPSRPDSGNSSKGWDNIGSIADRKKENSVEAKPWAGEKLKGGKTNGGMEKLMIFKDSFPKRPVSLPQHIRQSLLGNNNTPHQCVRNPKTGRLEAVFVDLEAVYCESSKGAKEYCFEELSARRRGWLTKEWSRERKQPLRAAPLQGLSFDTDPVATPNVESDVALQEPLTVTGTEHVAKVCATKQRGFKIFEDAGEERPSDLRHIEPAQEEPKLRREERANRTRKIQVMDVKHIKNETRTIQLNLDSPTGPKIKRKKSTERAAEPTMTINTREAMDEIYGIFNQPLPSQAEPAETEEEDSDEECTTGDESTATGKLSGSASEYGDETRNELLILPKSEQTGNVSQLDSTGWSDFTRSRDVRQDAASVYQDTSQSAAVEEEDEIVTPQDEHPRTQSVPLAHEDRETPFTHYRDLAMLPNHRLPFMTPIVEQTESSLGSRTARTEKDYFSAKTPSRRFGGPAPLLEDDEVYSSPFQEITADLAEEKRRVLQPIRTKTTKGTISLGQGTAKSQLAAKTTVAAAPEPVQKGPLVKEAHCNPMDPVLRHSILAQAKPALTSYEGYHEHLQQTLGRTAEIKKYIKTVSKASRGSVSIDKTAQTLALPPMLSFAGAEGTYTVKRELGAGTFAPVYLVENSAAAPTELEVNDENRPPSRVGKHTHRKHLEAVKMEDPPNAWEFYIIRQSHRRLGITRAADSIVRAHELHLYHDECFLVEEYRDQGTLLDLVNLARVDSASGAGMDEIIAMWLTVELLRAVEALHSKHLIHGDLKGDNVLVRFDDPGQEVDWSPTYFPSGAHGWASKGVCLIDFGRGIDMKQFVPDVAFIADWKTSEADCAEMREMRPWTYQIDYHGLAGIVHSLLFGKYMETIGEKAGTVLGQGATKTYKIRESLKRYWQTEMWSELFHLLLNPLAHVEAEEGRKLPVAKSMRRCREQMEAWLEENCEKGVGLKGMIAKMEVLIREKRRRSVKAA